MLYTMGDTLTLVEYAALQKQPCNISLLLVITIVFTPVYFVYIGKLNLTGNPNLQR